MLWTDATQLFGAILVIVGAVLPVVNPLGDAPIFLNMTHGCDESTRRELARRIALYSFVLILGTMILGTLVLRMFDLSIPVVQVAGGAVVCALGWHILSDDPKPQVVGEDVEAARSIALTRAFYPLTLPLTVDPGVLSVAMTLSANHSHVIEKLAIQLVAAVIGTAIVALSILLTYRYAQTVGRRLGHRGMLVVLRLSAFIVLCIGVQIAWNGIRTLLGQIGIGAH